MADAARARTLAEVVTTHVAEAALEAIPAPAFVINAAGTPVMVNSLGRAVLDASHGDCRARLAEVARVPRDSRDFRVTAIKSSGTPRHWLVVGQGAEPCTRAREAADRWQLSPRQRQVLTLLVDGASNARMAAILQRSERTIEVHVAAIFSRAHVNSRGALIAAVLGRRAPAIEAST